MNDFAGTTCNSGSYSTPLTGSWSLPLTAMVCGSFASGRSAFYSFTVPDVIKTWLIMWISWLLIALAVWDDAHRKKKQDEGRKK